MSQLIAKMKLSGPQSAIHVLVAVGTVLVFVFLIGGFLWLRESSDPSNAAFWIQQYKHGTVDQRAQAICVLSASRPYTKAVKAVMIRATHDKEDSIRFQAARSLNYGLSKKVSEVP
jgi:hypothetical protein